VLDPQFGTTDVLVVMKVADINPRYMNHYSTGAHKPV
jgi:L-ornithine Nalpha-acyltransferase